MNTHLLRPNYAHRPCPMARDRMLDEARGCALRNDRHVNMDSVLLLKGGQQ